MSYVESPVETFKKFTLTPGWQNASHEELAHDFFSISNETNLGWDQYVYEERNGRLFDPVRKRTVAGTANGDVVEEDTVRQLEEWFLTHDAGVAVWISPRSKIRFYPEEKLALHRIAYKMDGQKVLLCTSHQFKAHFKNPEEIRRFVFTEDDKEESVFEIIDWLKKVSEKKVETEAKNPDKRKAEAEFYAHQYISGASIDQIIYHMTQTGFLGQNPVGCGGSTLSTSSLSYTETLIRSIGNEDQYGSLEFSCPKCGATNIRPFGRLISNCKHCGGDVRC